MEDDDVAAADGVVVVANDDVVAVEIAFVDEGALMAKDAC